MEAGEEAGRGSGDDKDEDKGDETWGDVWLSCVRGDVLLLDDVRCFFDDAADEDEERGRLSPAIAEQDLQLLLRS